MAERRSVALGQASCIRETEKAILVELDGEERWKVIPGFPDYAVSDQGRVARITPSGRCRTRKGGLLSPTRARGKSYSHVTLTSPDGSLKCESVHKLVLIAFVGPRPATHECRHKDGDRSNNRLSNLAWGTHQENDEDRIAHGRMPRGEASGHARLTIDAVRQIRSSPLTDRALGRLFDVDPSTISCVRRRATWAWVD